MVRMRSPVRIWIAAPVKGLDFQGFFLFALNLLPVPGSHLATIWLLGRDFFVFMPLWRGDFPAHPLLSGRSPARHEHICSSWWRSARGRVCLILPAVQRLPQLFNDYNGTESTILLKRTKPRRRIACSGVRL